MAIKAIPSLKAEKRSGKGKCAVAELRFEGKVPANLYGKGLGNVELSLGEHELEMGLRLTPALLALESSEGTMHVLIKHVQYDTFGQRVLHMDLNRVELGDLVEVPVKLEFYGVPAGAADGGRLEVLKQNVLLKVRADSIPDLIRTSAAHLILEETITYSQLELPEGAELLNSPDGIVCACRVNKRAQAAARRAEVKRGKN